MSSRDPKTVLFAANSSWNLVNFRAPIIRGLLRRGYSVHAAVPADEAERELRDMGVEVHRVEIDARGLSPLADARLVWSYYALLRRLKPAAFLGFTAKPNIYGSIAAARLGIPMINTITGLGTGFLSSRILEGTVSWLYRMGLRRSTRVFFHNSSDRKLFVDRKMVTVQQAAIVAGSGVDLGRFHPVADKTSDRPFTFLFIGRLLKDKGALEFAQAAEIVRKNTSARFQMLGKLDDHPKAVSQSLMHAFAASGTIELLGSTTDVRPIIAEADCVVLPSYREGLPRVLLEAGAMATPVIATDVPGCRDAVDDGITGLLCQPRSPGALAEAMATMLGLLPAQRSAMGERARRKAEQEFSQDRVIEAYVDALNDIED